MRSTALRALATVMVCLAGVRGAQAQQSPAAGPGRIEASVGWLRLGRQPLGSADANETTPTGGALKIFSTASELATASGIEGRVAFRVLPALEVEVQGSYGVPQLKVAIGGDSEGAAAITAVENVQQFTIGAGVVWYVTPGSWRSRLVPFVTGGAGQLRQMHQERVLLDTGRYVQVGGGVKALLFSRPRGLVNAFGVRGDVRALVRSDGVAFDDRGHASPEVGVSAFVRF